MNWRRGLFRLWIVGSVLFVIAVAVISYSEIKAEFEAAKLLTQADLGDFAALVPAPYPWTILGIWASIAVGIPLAVLALGASLVWAFSGFAAKRS